jgi:hypothetical protein
MIEQPEVGYCLGILVLRHSARDIFLLADRAYFAILAVNELQWVARWVDVASR